MSQPELLSKVIAVLDDAGIGYMVTGSFASSLQGEPRLSHDIDLLIAIPESSVDRLLEAFPMPDYYLDRDAVLRSIRAQGGDNMFNLLQVTTGDKVDFWILTEQPFDRSRFSRRYRAELAGVKFCVSMPEDTILAKLRWAKECGGSEKQFNDALSVFEVQYAELDLGYLNDWATKLSVKSLLDELMDAAKEVE
jgi:hypothetical protein